MLLYSRGVSAGYVCVQVAWLRIPVRLLCSVKVLSHVACMCACVRACIRRRVQCIHFHGGGEGVV